MRNTLLFLAIIAAIGCNKEVTNKVDQDKIFTQYLLRYDENLNNTVATATFRFNSGSGTRLKLSEPSTVSVDQQPMTWNAEVGNYEVEFSGFRPTAVFDWIDVDGKAFSNEVNIVDVAFPATVDDLSYADSLTFFSWEGAAPLDSFELVRLTIDGPGTTDARIFTANEIGATFIAIDSLRLSQVDSGVVTLILEKQFLPELKEATTAGGTGIGSYIATNRTVNLN